MSLVSCHEDIAETPAPEGVGIAFVSALQNEAVQTRAGGTEPLARDFFVYGYKAESDAQIVFNGYTLHYEANTAGTSEDNTHNYSYAGGTSLTGVQQEIKYWDFSAAEYHFWGCSAVSNDRIRLATSPSTPLSVGEAEFSSASGNEGTTLTIPVCLAKDEPTEIPLYSELCERKPVSSNVVQMVFKRPYSKLCVQFYSNDAIDVDEVYKLTDITFGPIAEAASPLTNKIHTKGAVKVSYPKKCDPSEETVTLQLDDEAQKWSKLPFLDVELNASHGTASNNAVTALIPDGKLLQLDDMPGVSLAKGRSTAPSTRRDHYYVLPMGVTVEGSTDWKNPAFVMTLRLEGETKTAVVPASFMQWKPNCHYTYIFKITELGRKIEFFDVSIDPWLFGGSQDEEFRNW